MPHNSSLHPRNSHRQGYDFDALQNTHPPLRDHMRTRPDGASTIDFSDPNAVKALNTALLRLHYGIQHWDLPDGYLCPPVPGRADYLYYLQDLIRNTPSLASAKKINVLDLGTGANLIYPILGVCSFFWSFVASETDARALQTAAAIIQANPRLRHQVELRPQTDRSSILQGLIQSSEQFTLSMCNPPFYESTTAALRATQRKQQNLGTTGRNFQGQEHELCYPGGELGFLRRYVDESQAFAQNVHWFTALVSSKATVPILQRQLRKIGTVTHRIIPMQQGQKRSRILAWRYTL